MSDFALKVLLVEDNDDLREATQAFLQSRGHFVRAVSAAEELGELSDAFVPDVYIIDLNLPDEDGLSLVRRLRRVQPLVGIIITTARTQIGDKVSGYESGADLYLTKPVAPLELLAGIGSLAKRIRAQSAGDCNLHFFTGKLLLSGPLGQTDLSRGEAALLCAFIRAPSQSLERWQLSELLADGITTPPPPPLSAATLEMRVARLRKKLAEVGSEQPAIKALRKFGYQLCCKISLK